MKRIGILFTLLNFYCVIVMAQEEPVPVFPSSPFNRDQADAMLNAGTAMLHGVVTKKKKNPDNTYLGIVVILFPCTPYFDEWYELQKKNKKGKTFAMMSPDAYSYRILTKASDKDGRFEFRNLKPGRYYLQTMVRQGKMKEMWNQVGTSTSVGYNIYGQAVTSYSRPIYEDFKLFYETNDLVKNFVEITSEGQVVNVKL
ncbi:hypothetical protein H9N25_00690 [Pedobacter riviphilus]|uniref:Carboxypeptidase regulatory-like domain-containing protein n=1 Tax=Pedobacter riviphilus TaxID=2766984 RepID=A0ABX6TK63_9SPHI|nr:MULTISPECIES: prealbumin-like fold domain-containing protein [Pedobacter]NII81071.1 hypothetical protein [Pedobacter sp. SG908]NMN35088.1 hypothetical protein [Pedobacter sp. SG918]QNR85062.1 hypothetical protein H9N25_00690 [Pedobacter riviphilus]